MDMFSPFVDISGSSSNILKVSRVDTQTLGSLIETCDFWQTNRALL